jgi:hypothetical protein
MCCVLSGCLREHVVCVSETLTTFLTTTTCLCSASTQAYAPLWIGGHVVGFCSFFIYLRVTGADLLRSDAVLQQEEVLRL